MKQIALSKWLKFIIIGVGICGLIIYGIVIPMLGQHLAAYLNGEFDHCYWPWLVLIWITAVPCYIVLVFSWKIASNIGNDKSFTVKLRHIQRRRDQSQVPCHITLFDRADHRPVKGIRK